MQLGVFPQLNDCFTLFSHCQAQQKLSRQAKLRLAVQPPPPPLQHHDRLATVQNADRILLLNENRLVAMGTHQELLAKNPYYQTLVANQQIQTGLGIP